MMGAPGEVNRELTGDEVAMTPIPAIRPGLWRTAMGPHLTLLIVALGVSGFFAWNIARFFPNPLGNLGYD